MDEDLKDYRQHLVLAEQDAQRSYDKIVITLASAGLGISFALVGNYPELRASAPTFLLLLSWTFWGVSLVIGLGSHLMSQQALRRMIAKVDGGQAYEGSPGGMFGMLTDVFNFLTGIFFVLGILFFALFVGQSLGGN